LRYFYLTTIKTKNITENNNYN